jgi:hypothetical protein
MDRLIPIEGACVITNNRLILSDHDPFCIGVDINQSLERRGEDPVFVPLRTDPPNQFKCFRGRALRIFV